MTVCLLRQASLLWEGGVNHGLWIGELSGGESIVEPPGEVIFIVSAMLDYKNL